MASGTSTRPPGAVRRPDQTEISPGSSGRRGWMETRAATFHAPRRRLSKMRKPFRIGPYSRRTQAFPWLSRATVPRSPPPPAIRTGASRNARRIEATGGDAVSAWPRDGGIVRSRCRAQPAICRREFLIDREAHLAAMLEGRVARARRGQGVAGGGSLGQLQRLGRRPARSGLRRNRGSSPALRAHRTSVTPWGPSLLCAALMAQAHNLTVDECLRLLKDFPCAESIAEEMGARPCGPAAIAAARDASRIADPSWLQRTRAQWRRDSAFRGARPAVVHALDAPPAGSLFELATSPSRVLRRKPSASCRS